jgi:hypothetical protein
VVTGSATDAVLLFAGHHLGVGPGNPVALLAPLCLAATSFNTIVSSTSTSPGASLVDLQNATFRKAFTTVVQALQVGKDDLAYLMVQSDLEARDRSVWIRSKYYEFWCRVCKAALCCAYASAHVNSFSARTGAEICVHGVSLNRNNFWTSLRNMFDRLKMKPSGRPRIFWTTDELNCIVS